MSSSARIHRSIGDHAYAAPSRQDPFGDPPRQFTSWRSAVASMCILAIAVASCLLLLAGPFVH